MTEKLKPCPFCGSETAPIKKAASSAHRLYQVICTARDGGCGSSSGWWSTFDKAIAAWNKRADQ